jgi:hypothetical protein
MKRNVWMIMQILWKVVLEKKLRIEKIFVDVEELSKVIDMNEDLLIKHCD